MSDRHVALAYSGGLDTSFCAVWLREQGYRVTTVTVDTGGFDAAELARIERVSAETGAAAHVTVDARGVLYDRFLRYLIFGNVLRGGTYPLSVSAERVCQAERVVDVAREVGATALAHGSTGAGNDQVRFDVAFQALAPELEMVTPIRALALSRQDEARYLDERGIAVPARTRDYSVNEGMWGASVGGRETLGSWETLPDAVYPSGEVAAPPPRELVLTFERGVPVAIDGAGHDPVAVIDALNALGRGHGIGRGVHLGDTVLGIKGRVGFDAPAAHLLIGAHRELEKLVLSGRQLFWKETLGNLYGSLLHEGHHFDPLARDIEAFLASTQQRVSGDVRLTLRARSFSVDGTRSPYSMMAADVASYGETNTLWTGDEARGFAKLHGLQQLLARRAGGGPS